MESILVLVHTDESGVVLTRASLEAVTAGLKLSAQLKGSLSIGIFAVNANAAADSLGSTGARLMAVENPALEQAQYATDAAACEALCRAAQAKIVLAPGSARMMRVAAGVAHRLGGAVDTHVSSLNATPEMRATRWFYRQRIEAVVSREMRPWVLVLDPGTHAPFSGDSRASNVERVSVSLPASRTSVTGFLKPAADAQTIRPDAKMLFVAGAGWTKKQPDGQVHAAEARDTILEFLTVSRASLGSSKSLVDQGGDGQPVLPFLTHMNQIGQTGATPRHAKGLATCCYGEEPHVVGWRFIGERRAISLDPNCGWTRGKADVVYIADAFKVMARVTSILKTPKG